MLAVVSSGGDIDLPVCGVKFLIGEVEMDYGTTGIATPLEIVSSTLSTRSLDSEDGLKFAKKLQAFIRFIQHVKARNPFKNSQPLSCFMKTLLLKEDFCDIELLCPDGTVYPAHQNVMANSSHYFKTYFTGPWSRLQSGEGGGSGQYETQIHSEILKYILTFMYTGNFGRSVVGMPTSTMCDIFHAAHEFQIDDLVVCCCKVLQSRITLDTIKEIVICAAAMIDSSSPQPSNNSGSTNGSQNGADKRLWTGCIKFIRNNAADVLLDTDFYTLKDKYPNLWKDLQEEISQSRKRKRDEETE